MSEEQEKNGKPKVDWVDLIFRILALAIIPAAGYILDMHSDLQTKMTTIAVQQGTIDELKSDQRMHADKIATLENEVDTMKSLNNVQQSLVLELNHRIKADDVRIRDLEKQQAATSAIYGLIIGKDDVFDFEGPKNE